MTKVEVNLTGNSQWRFLPQELDEVLVGKGHNALLGQRYHAHGPDWIELAMPWQKGLTGRQGAGALAAGPIITLMDNGTGVAVWLKRGGYFAQVTIDLRVDFLRPTTRGETLICRCECYKLTPSIGFSRGIAYETSPDDPVCHAVGTFMLLEGQA